MGEKGEKLFWTGVDRVMNIVLLGFLWLICSLPVGKASDVCCCLPACPQPRWFFPPTSTTPSPNIMS